MVNNGIQINGSGVRTAVGVNKRGLAARYAVGIRTIENWMAGHIIAGRMVGGQMIFDVQECDRRLFACAGSIRPENEIPARLTERNETGFADKVALARRYGVCKRTIDQWLGDGLLICFKVKHVVRFDAPACDDSLQKHRMIDRVTAPAPATPAMNLN